MEEFRRYEGEFHISGWHKSTEASSIRLPAIYNDVPFDSRLKTADGFSSLIEGVGQTILFDTGYETGSILLENMKRMRIDPRSVDVVFLSHKHVVGGLDDFLGENSGVTVYLLESFPQSIKRKIKTAGAEFKVINEPAKLLDTVHSTGKMQLAHLVEEQSLIFETSQGLVIITGCAHPGIANVVGKAKDLFNDEVLLIMGGFHLNTTSKRKSEVIIDELKKLGVKQVAPSQCTGMEAMALFREALGDDFFGRWLRSRYRSATVISSPS